LVRGDFREENPENTCLEIKVIRFSIVITKRFRVALTFIDFYLQTIVIFLDLNFSNSIIVDDFRQLVRRLFLQISNLFE